MLDFLTRPVPNATSVREMLLKHHDYGAIEKCQCAVCGDFRAKIVDYRTRMRQTVSHSKNCPCHDCTAKMKSRSAYIVANNRRDLFCEMSWHASEACKECGLGNGAGCMSGGVCRAQRDMERVWNEVAIKSRKADGWWEITASYLSMGQWLDFFRWGKSSQIPAASGAY